MKSTKLLLVPIAAFFLLLSSGCSVAGYMVGGELDEGQEPTYAPVMTNTLFGMEEGVEIRVERHDETAVEGSFVRLALPGDEELLEAVPDREEESRSGWNIAAGDRIFLIEKGKHGSVAVFLGATTTEIWHRDPNAREVLRTRFRDTERLSSGAVDYSQDYLQHMVDGHLEPVYTLEVRDSTGVQATPLRDVQQLLLTKRPNSMRNTLAWIGGAVDLTVFMALLPSVSTGDQGGGGGGSSSFMDGLVRVLDGFRNTGL